MPNLLVRYIAKYQVQNEWGKIRGLIRSSNYLVVIISSFLVISSLFLLHFDLINLDNREIPVFYWGLALLPVIALGSIRGAILRGLRHIVLGLAPEHIVKHLLFIILLLVANKWIVQDSLTPANAMCFNFISALLAYLIGVFWLLKLLPAEVKNSRPKYQYKEWSIVALPLLLTGGMQIINSKIDIVLLGWLSTSFEVGIYEVSWKGASLVSFGLGALNLLLAPYFSRFFYTNQINKLQKVVTFSVVLNCLLGAGVTSVYIFYGEDILNFFFGSDFVAGYPTLLILCFAHLINISSGSVGLLLNMTGYEREVLLVLAIAAVTNIFLNLHLIPLFGMEGAAIASLITYLLWNLILVVLSVKYIGVNSSIFSIHKLLIK